MSVTVKTNEASRLNFRLPAHIKERIENAALLSGTTVTDFAISALANTADEVLDRHQNLRLSNRDRDLFLSMLKNPPKPNAALRKAVKNYKKRNK